MAVDETNVVTTEDVVTGTTTGITEPNITTQTIVPAVEPTVTKPDKNAILRKLSEKTKLNLFEPEGLEQLESLLESQELTLSGYKTKETTWEQDRLNYESKLKASELGIHPDKLEDALKLAGNDPSKLPEVVQKYPIFKSKEVVTIGVQDPANSTPPTDLSEVEAYMAQNPVYSYYNKTKK